MTGSPGCNIGRTFRAEFRWLKTKAAHMKEFMFILGGIQSGEKIRRRS